MIRDYKRNGTTTLFTAVNMLDGKIIGTCMPHHRHREFLRILKRIDQQTSARPRSRIWSLPTTPPIRHRS